MSKKEQDARWMAEQLEKLPETAQEHVHGVIVGVKLATEERQKQKEDAREGA